MIYAAVTRRGVEMRRNHTEGMEQAHAGSLFVVVNRDLSISRGDDLLGGVIR
jgi:hypothetical protein